MAECLVCFEDLVEATTVMYRTGPDSKWEKSTFCLDCIRELQQRQYPKYIEDLQKSDCEAERRRLFKKGPPINVYDRLGFPSCADDEVHTLMVEGVETSAKLDGSLTGEERQIFWDEQVKILAAIYPEEVKASES
eukprot:GHVO01000782.1.p1 GENE.GHVO01000782.1~~GHVO01000782.1.p1  ORF type:complete len:135 (-),score=24.84 GHVO01000782.1:104-508(-)